MPLLRFHVVVMAGLTCAAWTASAQAQLPDTLPRQVPAGPGDLAPKVGNLCRVQIAPAYREERGEALVAIPHEQPVEPHDPRHHQDGRAQEVNEPDPPHQVGRRRIA